MLREKQKSRIKSFLMSQGDLWKVLVLDNRAKEIISPLFSVRELRDCGVTTYFMSTKKRCKISNTPALYFVQDVTCVIEDVINELYSGYFVNCVNTIRRADLERVGLTLAKQGLGNQIRSLYDQFLDFVSLQDDFYSFEMKDSYLHKDELDVWRGLVNSVMSLFVTLENVPIIFGTDDMSNDIGKMIEEKIKGTKILKKQTKRPVLILVNRNYDVFTPVQHVWSYSALINDIFGIRSNKVEVKDKAYDLDPSDPLWKNNRNEYFPLVAEIVQQEFVEYKKEMALRSIDSRSDKKMIQKTLEKTPELARKNVSVTSHIAICLEMVEQIKNRSLDEFYRIEKSGYTDEELMDISEKGTDDDILRLALNLINSKDSDLAEAIIKKRNIKTDLVKFFKSFRNKFVEKSVISNVVSSLMGNVQKFLPVKEKSPLSCLVEDVISRIRNQDMTHYSVYDPIKDNRLRISDVSCVVVCMIGGCTYQEHKTLKILEDRIKIPILYGGTEVLNAKSFLDQVRQVNK